VVVGLEATANLLVAAADLKLVRLLRDAIRTADLSSRPGGGGGSPSPIGTMPQAASFTGRPIVHPTPRFEPRPVIHPTPRFEPRPVIHPTPREVPPVPPPCDGALLRPIKRHSPLDPPWKMPVHELPLPRKLKLKVVLHRTDCVHKGSLIDLFI
jgi:hypothetical protein